MRASESFISTIKENPNDAELASHRLMLRAGLIRKLGAGLYSWLPLGLKVLRKIEAIIRDEMHRAGALEVFLPAVQPAEIWQETGRWDSFGGQLLTMKDAQGRAYCFGPTHEEVITDLLRKELHSYKQLPLNFYQIQTKFRDEIRPRFGVMRAREFIMKDAYSFHINASSLQTTYDKMYHAYERVLTRIGLAFRAVQADTGAIGGAVSHEFQVLAQAGEDVIFYSDASDYAANIEMATSLTPEKEHMVAPGPCTLVNTPQQKTIDAVSLALNLPASRLLKTLVVAGQDVPAIALIIKGDDELNEIKACKHPWIKAPLHLIAEDELKETHGLCPGFMGPIDLNIPCIIDNAAWSLAWFACGANQMDKHFVNANWDSIDTPELFDLRNVNVGDKSPDGQGQLQSCHGIEVGHVFQLGQKYSESMKLQVLNEHGKPQTVYMGCYGLGVSRLVAAAIEQHHDDKGIIWPEAIAPFDVVLIPINQQQAAHVLQITGKLYQDLQDAGFDVLLDDRNERPGVLFADHDLIGIPHRVVISEKSLANGTVEYKHRQHSNINMIAVAELIQLLQQSRSNQ